MSNRNPRLMNAGACMCERLEDRAMMAADLVSGGVGIVERSGPDNSRVTVRHTVANTGDVAAPGGYLVRFFLSSDTVIGAGDRLVREVHFPFTLQPGGSETYTKVILLPRGIDSGDYRLIAKIDPLGQVPESNEGNNTQTSRPLTLFFKPAIEKLDINRKWFTVGQTIRLTARNVQYLDPGVGEVRFYMDVNGYTPLYGYESYFPTGEFIGVGVRDGNDYVLTTTVDPRWVRYDATFSAQAVKSGWPNMISDVVRKTIVGVGGEPTIGSLDVNPTQLVIGQTATITAHGVSTGVSFVSFNIDSNFTGKYEATDYYPWQPVRNGNDWSVSFTVPDWLPTVTPTKIWATARDDRGLWSRVYEIVIQPAA